MPDLKQGEWKLILGSATRTIRGIKTAKVETAPRQEKVYEIVTNDNRQLILGSYIKLQSIEGLDDKKVKELLEINGEYYQGMGSQSYHQNLAFAVKQYITDCHILSPKKDIVKIEDAVQLYVDAEKEFKKLCNLGGKK